MDIIPAVDIMKGKVVRLCKGEPRTAKSYEGFEKPLQTARLWVMEGAQYLHIVDLDAAMGQGDNYEIISKIISKIGIPVQVGGGIRRRAVAETLLNAGVRRVIVATLAFRREDILKALIEEYGSSRVMVALDYLDGIVITEGWQRSTGTPLEKAMEKFLKLGVDFFLLTSISRDGLLMGPDYMTLKSVIRRFSKKFFIAGGVASLTDLVRLKSINVDGVVIGKALYEKKFSLRDALDMVKE